VVDIRGLWVMEPTSKHEFEWSYDDYDDGDEPPEGEAEDGEDDGDSR